ncbi:AzlC family ABC transporter permease [Fusobacterium gastrosuis]|uniref:AzlC family ABC transporter permease n=1 Tax=Fusobacterium gastrosuis TaxID=1755100 RepID=UPI0025F01297|nr:AzlC family ABC transporter permease [uncultured Fusobacterium sp.]MDD7410888.1 AzlC family ABC transporter permease [Fusobacteriaceae bacterium]MDY5713241.1 AzlC family ABC transporter permease [Fusobacterium gastrosuis]
MQKNKTLKYAFFKSIPVMAGYIVLGIGFGILLYDKGYSYWWALAMSTFIYAGSMQYIGIELLSSGASFISIALVTLLVNARHIFYGISMLENYKNTGKFKPYLIATLTDETYSLVCGNDFPDYIDKRKYYFYLSLFNHFYWILGSFIGSILGSTFSFNTKGIDFSMTALFVIIFVEQWEKNKNHLPAMLGLIISILCLLIFGKSNFLIPAMVLISLSLIFLRKFINKKEENDA